MVATLQTAPRRRARTRVHRGTAGVLAAYVVLVLVANRWGQHLLDTGHVIKVATPPLRANWDAHLSYAHVAVLIVGGALLLVAPRVAARASWKALLVTAPLFTALWTVALNSTRGTDGFLRSLRSSHDSLADVAAVTSPLTFLRDFTHDFDGYATHTQGHPPGFVLVLWMLRAIGFGGPAGAAVLCIAAGSLAVIAVLVTVRDVAGEETARAAAPFVLLAPVALWVATSADAFFMLLAACAVAGMVRAATRADGRIGPAVFGGTCFGLALLCSYGTVLIAVIPIVLALRLGKLAPLIPAAVATGAVLLAALAAGFDYLEGLRLTREAYFVGVAHDRPHSYALIANVAALAIAIGPAIAVALFRVRGRLAVLVGASVVAIALADLSGMSKLEVERIWLPFAVWLLPAGAVLATGGRASMSRWLALQMGSALVVQTMVRTGW